MKKFLIALCLLIVLAPTMVCAKDNKKINIYMFHGNGCPHCAKALEFFKSIEGEYGKYYKLVKFETWTSFNAKKNNKLLYKVAEGLGEDTSSLGVPFIVIGEKVFRGYAPSYDEEIKKAIVDAYNDDDYVDKVKPYVDSMKNGLLTNVAIAGGLTIGLAGLIILNLYLRKTKKQSTI